MTDTQQLRSALTRIIWGYLFLYLDLNLGVNGHSLSVLPNWVSYLLFFSAIGLLEEEVRDLSLLKPFCVLLGIAEGVNWLGVLLTGETVLYRFYLVYALVICISIYFNFQMLTDVAALVEARNIDAGALRGVRNGEAVLRAVTMLPLPWQDWELLSALLALAGIVMCLCMVGLLIRARKMCCEGTT